MSEMETQQSNHQSDEISLKELILKIRDWSRYLLSKWKIILIVGIIGAVIGFFYAFKQKAVYTAVLSFVLEDEKNSGGGLGGALGLASSLGIDVGSSGAGGAFVGANLMELIKSRTLVEKALLDQIIVHNKKKSLADYFIEVNGINKNWHKYPRLNGLSYPLLSDRSQFSFLHDSIMGGVYEMIVKAKQVLSVQQKDKKSTIITVECKSIDEGFAKIFVESLVKEVSSFYIETKSKKARKNVDILQKQVDSIRSELNAAISGVANATDNTYNLNPAMNIQRVPSTKRQVDVQANSAILTQLVVNLELAKVTLLKETPLIQVIDNPMLPLNKEQFGKVKGLFLGSFFGVFLSAIILLFNRWRTTILDLH